MVWANTNSELEGNRKGGELQRKAGRQLSFKLKSDSQVAGELPSEFFSLAVKCALSRRDSVNVKAFFTLII